MVVKSKKIGFDKIDPYCNSCILDCNDLGSKSYTLTNQDSVQSISMGWNKGGFHVSMGSLVQSCYTKGLGWVGHKILINFRILSSRKIRVEYNNNEKSMDDRYQKKIHRPDRHG